METHKLKIINKQYERHDITLQLSRKGWDCCMTAESSVTGKVNFSGYDYFKCLTKLRLLLESKGYLILCLGATKNITLSRMCSESTAGLKAYQIELGKEALIENLIDVLEPIQNGAVTVEEQENFRKQWLQTFKI